MKPKKQRLTSAGAVRRFGAQEGEDRVARDPQAESPELMIECLEERLTPGYPIRTLKRNAGWGC